MRLQGWKEISGYLKCGIRTAQRWEKHGLPVRQLKTNNRKSNLRSPVFAFSAELDDWIKLGGVRQPSRISSLELVRRSAQLRAEVREARLGLRARLESLHQEIATLRKISAKQELQKGKTARVGRQRTKANADGS
jgi:hypothetical protein